MFADDLNAATAEIFSWQTQLAATSSASTEARLLKPAHERFLEGRRYDTIARLEYAQRSAPSHLGIALLLGYARLQAEIPSATEPLEFLLRRVSNRDAWFGLAAARLQAGDAAAAASELNEGLSCHSPPSTAWGRRLTANLVDQTGALGWCGLRPDGVLILGGRAASATRNRLSLMSGGVPVAFRIERLRSQRRTTNRTRFISLGSDWREAHRLDVMLDGVPLLGSPIRVQNIVTISGFVSAESGEVSGWCWHPNAEDFAVQLTIEDASSGARLCEIEASAPLLDADAFGALDRPRRFRIMLDALSHEIEQIRVLGPCRANLYGNPIDPFGEQQSAAAAVDAVALRFPAANDRRQPATPRQPSAAADVRGRPPVEEVGTARAPVDVVIPVYRGREVTLKALECVFASDEGLGRIIVVSDASPDSALINDLEMLALEGRIILQKEQRNRGFPGAANIGLRLAEKSDVVLLNSDAFVSPHWLRRLQEIAYSASDIGTVTPISNDATIFSYPKVDKENAVPGDDERLELAAAAWAANAGVVVDVPSAHGFCMFIRRRCLNEIGLLREDVFGQGYGEENDLSIRASNKGWRNVVTPGVYVAHVGGQSFAAARVHLVKRNLQIMNRLHPGYDALIQIWLRADPLGLARRAIDVEVLRHWRSPNAKLALFLTHNRGGGVARHVRERIAALALVGIQAALLRPGAQPNVIDVRYGADEAGDNLHYDLPDELDSFTKIFSLLNPVRIEIHHSMDIHPAVLKHILDSKVPYDITIHDFHWYCPRINLTKGRAHYCGEPPAEFCRQCIQAEGSEFMSPVDPVELQKASRQLMTGAVDVTVPSIDTARRITRRLQIIPSVRPWEQDHPIRPKPMKRESHDAVLRVCIVGAIGWEKGFGILLSMAQVIAFEQLPIELRLVGFTCDDERLGAFDCVKITGRYDEGEVIKLIERQDAHLGLLPAVWPETWSYVLTTMWTARLSVAAFNIGAPAERIRKMGGHLFPMTTTPRALAHGLLKLTSS